jgi:hypothetical protein
VLKNVLDLMCFEEFEGKMLGLLACRGTLGRVRSHAQPCETSDARCTRGWFPSKRVCLNRGGCSTNRGRCKDVETGKRLKEVGRQVVRFAFLHTAEQAGEFLRQFESVVEHPVGENRSPRGTLARVQATTKDRVDFGVRLDGTKPSGRLQPSRIHETMKPQISFTKPGEVDVEAMRWLKKAYDQNCNP